ncbi:MAG: multi-sensor signal transduction histidine kinase [Firmicutes bacterium]|nr:multi-sensor signal transduction histidine kinase [Bacillota bacterium]
MNKHFKPAVSRKFTRELVIGMGESSARKSYYPELQERMAELERFRALLEQARDALFLIDLATFTIVDANAIARSTCEPFQLIGSSITEWLRIPGLFDSPTLEQFLDALDGGTDGFLQCPNGQSIPIDISSNQVQLNEGIFLIILARDITERKKAEEELRQARNDLESRVIERTAALLDANQSLLCEISERKQVEKQLKLKNQELKTAYAELETVHSQIIYQEKMASIGQLAAAVAHEIRNPMTTVRGYLQLMERKKEYQGDKEKLELMIEELDRANAIICEYLSLSRDKLANLKSHSLNNIIELLFPLIQASANASNVSVNLDLADIPELFLDENEIRQLLLNLVRNSIEAMPSGGKLAIHTLLEERKVILSISDQGSGIPLHILNNLGTPFITSKDTGTGLGIPICYQIADRHSAEIKIKTSENGTTFFICFNLSDVAD